MNFCIGSKEFATGYSQNCHLKNLSIDDCERKSLLINSKIYPLKSESMWKPFYEQKIFQNLKTFHP